MTEEISKKKLLVMYVGTFYIILIIIMGAISDFGTDIETGVLSEEHEQRAGEIVNEGVELFETGDYVNAIIVWREVYNDYKGTTSWGKATYNIGLAYINLNQYDIAIEYFLEILDSDVDDLEAGQGIMEAYRNYRYKSCIKVSYCYEMLENYDKALDYIILARDKYPYQSWCGTCSISEQSSLEKKIRRLTLFLKWNLKKEKAYEFKLEYFLLSKPEIEYTVYLPFPLAKDNSTSYFFNNIKIINGTPIFSTIQTDYGYALNVTSKGLSSIEITYSISFNEEITENKIYNRFSTQDDGKRKSFWIYSLYGGEEWDDRITLTLKGYWVKYPPEWEYYEWSIYEFPMEFGWNRGYINSYYW